MAVPTDLNSLSTTAGSNAPAGSDAIGTTADDYLRGIQAVLRQGFHKGADIPSAGTTDLSATVGSYHDITGTTTITSFGSTGTAGITKILQFDGALTLTYNSTSMILLGGGNRTTVIGDVGVYVCEGSGNWREVAYHPVSGSPVASGFTKKNAIINGDFRISQRGTSFTAATTPLNSDDTFLLDRWVLLSDGDDVVDVVKEGTTIPTNGLFAISLDVETINKKFGILQVIEQNNCKGLIGKTCTLSFQAKVSATTKLDNLKAAIISWDGSADVVTSDIVSAWSIEDTVPVLVANWTYENTAVNLTPTTSYATYSVSAAIDTASTKNIGVFIWSDVTDTTAGDFLFITDVQLELGSVATPFEIRTHQEELELCKWYYERQVASAADQRFMWGFCDNTTSAIAQFNYTEKRVDPSIGSGTAASDFQVRAGGGAGNIACTVLTPSSSNRKGCAFTGTVAAGLTAGEGMLITAVNANAYIEASAEL